MREQFKEQKQVVRAQEKLIERLLRILQKQEAQVSTEDFRVFLEFDREPQLNMLDISKIREEQQRRQFELDKVELDTQEYIQLKQRIKDLELQNQLLLSQSRILKSQTFREIGSA